MYWIYDIPNWLLFLLTTGVFGGASLLGYHLTRPVVRRIVDGSGRHNDITSFHFAAVGVLYGLTLGLIAVATWQNFSDADSKAAKEANSIGALYRDFDGYPTPLRAEAENLLRDYTKVVIGEEWPAHQKGQILDRGDQILEELENKIMAFEPSSETQKIAQSEVIRSLNKVVENRGYRVQSVSTALPGVLWCVVLIGAVINIGITYLFWVENTRLHAVLVATFACSLAILIFLTAAMDNPYRGEFSISSDTYKYVLEHVMTKNESRPARSP
jgi:hypothetical protein